MKHVFMKLSITYYSTRNCAMCLFFQKTPGSKLETRELTLNEARKLQWELMKAGGTRKVTTHPYINTIYDVEIEYWI